MVDSIKKKQKLTGKSGASHTDCSALQQKVGEAPAPGSHPPRSLFWITVASDVTRQLPAPNSHLALTLKQSFLKNFRNYLRRFLGCYSYLDAANLSLFIVTIILSLLQQNRRFLSC